jgi:cytochrome P450
VIATFILAMVQHPQVKKSAQAELDAVISKGQLPNFGDEASLPYISAVMKEIQRWQVATPIGLSHFILFGHSSC